MNTFFKIASAVILFVTGMIKLTASMGDALYLQLPDPVLLLEYRTIFLGVGLVEMTCAGWLMMAGEDRFKLLPVLWLSSGFLLYRGALALVAPGAPCPCLGSMAQTIGISAGQANMVSLAMALFLFFGSGLLLLNQGRSAASPRCVPARSR